MKLLVVAAAKATRTPGAVLPGMVIVTSSAVPVVLTRMLALPVIVRPLTPTRLTTPSATSAWPPFSATSPIRAFVSSTPMASGLRSPLPSRAGPRPRKSEIPSPAKACALDVPTVIVW